MALYDINGNAISNGSGNSFFKEVETLQNGLQLPIPPNNFTSNDNWQYSGNSGNLATAIGGTRYLYLGRVFTGRVYVRFVTPSPFVNIPIKMSLVAEDYITNQTAEGTTLEATANYTKFNGSYVGVEADTLNGFSTTDYNALGLGCVRLQQFDIPEGQYAVLSSTGAGTTNGAIVNAPNWFTVFTLDPTENIMQKPNGDALNILSAINEEGFGKGTAENTHFLSYLKNRIDDATPLYYKPQTYGKSLYLGGDSLHNYSGGNGFDDMGFATKYNKYLGFAKVTNAGYAGSTWSGTTGGGGIKRVTDLVTAGVPYDVFILAWGTNNDTGGDGTIDDTASNADGCTMVAAMKWCITQLRTTFRYSAIGVIIPPPKNSNEGMKTRGDLMISVCEQLHVPYVDMRKYLSMDDMSSDGVHLGYGADKYGTAEAKLILEICPYGVPLT